MKKIFWHGMVFVFLTNYAYPQHTMTPDLLWKLGRINPIGISNDQKSVVYSVTNYEVEANTKSTKNFLVNIETGETKEIQDFASIIKDKALSPNKSFKILAKDVKVEKISGSDFYQNLPNSNVRIYEQLNYRHWDTWEDGQYSHLWVETLQNGTVTGAKDIMEGEKYDCPQKPFGSDEDYTWSPDGKYIVYVSKKKHGTDYALSTNTDLYQYNVETGETKNITESNHGYDVHPSFSSSGVLAYLSMKNDGYESDKNDLMVLHGDHSKNITAQWDGTVENYIWNNTGTKIFFTAPIDGTVQLFEVEVDADRETTPVINQITKGDFDIQQLVGVSGDWLIATKTDMNHAAELYKINTKNGELKPLSHINEKIYKTLHLPRFERKYIQTTDGKKMLVWIVFPPDFDPAKKYPSILYCQGGPQSQVSQFYSFRWNFQLMASQGYIVIAPCRRGMPGFGVEWNTQISKDYGGQAMKDYLVAADEMVTQPYIDDKKMACVGASFGGYSVFYLAGIHNNRFKSFIAHCGIFNLKSMYGSTEELFFVNWDFGGPYWDKNNTLAQKTYQQFDPIQNVHKWNTPILIFHGEKDYRVPYSQGMEAFQAAQLKKIKSKFIVFPNENHWVLDPQNSLIWHHEFFKWLQETL